MDTYENNEFYDGQPQSGMPPMENTQPEPQAQHPPQAEPQPQYRPQPESNGGVGAGRKESPFANSPYMTAGSGWQNTAGYQQQSYTYTRPAYTPPSPEVKQEKKSGGKLWSRVLACILVLAVVAAGCGITASVVERNWEARYSQMEMSFAEQLAVLEDKIEKNSNVSSGNSVSGSPTATVDGLTPAQVYAQNVQSVVAIRCTTMVTNFGQMSESTSSGSGFFLTEDGYVVSNYHVVAGASSITVITSDGSEYEAEYVGGEENNDLALLKVASDGFDAAAIGSSGNLIVGDQVVAIGNPLGELASTLTVGYVSAKDRVVTTDGTQINMLQTDAAINPGNSGGPLFNMKGEVVGITSAKYSGTTTSGATIEGIGFAIPMDDVIGMLEDLKEFGYVTGAYLGVSVGDVEESVADRYGMPLGALVAEVVKGSCAEAAGIRAQDIIVNLGGHTVECVNDLTRALRKFEPGDTITVTVYRFGSGETQLTLTLDEKPQQTQEETVEPTVENSLPSNGSVEDWFNHFFG